MVKPPADDKAPASGGGKAFRSRFWNGSNSTQRHTVVQGDPISKQFNPNRQQGAETWLKPAEEENGDIPFSYTPFKTNTLGRESQVRGRTPQPNEVIDHRVHNGSKEQMRHSGTLTRPTTANPVMQQRPPPQTNGAPVVHRPQNAHVPPPQQQHQQQQQQQQQRPSPPLTNGHSDPKMMEQPASRLASRASAYTMSAFAGGRSRSDVSPGDQRAAPTATAYHAQQWTAIETVPPQAQQMQQPPMNTQQQKQPQQHQQWSNGPPSTHWGAQQARPVSAMPPSQIPRAHSRAASEMLIVAGSRYQSYTTLPRPEMLDIVDHPSYVGGGGYPADGGAPPPMPLHPEMKTSCFENSGGLPASLYPMHPRQQQDMVGGKQQMMTKQKEPKDIVDDYDNNCETISWSVVLKLAVLLILLSMVVFGLGLARVLLKAKWGLGVELVYAVFVFIAGLLGLIGAVKRHYCSVVACFIMSALSCIIAIPPMIIGLVPTVPWTFSNVDKSYFVSENEPYAVDIVLSAMCLLQISIGLIVAGVGCCTAGRVLARTDEMYFAVGTHSNSSHTEEKSTSTMNLIQ